MSAIACKFCFVDGLSWGKDSLGKWALFYESGQRHKCIGTRAAIAKAIPKPAKSFWNEKELEKWRKRQPVTPPMPAEWSPEWFTWLCLETQPKPQLSRCDVAHQQELIP